MDSDLKSKESRKEGEFCNKLMNILKATNYEGIGMFTGTSKRYELTNYVESFEGMQPFLDWFSNCITEENCLTTDELRVYNNLKMTGGLVPDELLDAQINSYFEESEPDLLLNNYEVYHDFVKQELEALESLDNFLSKKEKNEERKKPVSNVDVGSHIKNELSELEKLNKDMNKALENYAMAWENLRKNSFEDRMESKNYFDGIAHMLNTLNKKIDEDFNYHLQNDFREVKPTEGKIQITKEIYWIIFNRFKNVKDEIISTVAKTEGISSFRKKLEKLLKELSTTFSPFSLNTIKEVLHEENNLCKLREHLSVILKDEADSITTIQLYDSNKSTEFLNDRLDRLNKLEHLLKHKKLYNLALFFVINRKKVVQKYQLEKLNEFLTETQLTVSKFQERMDFMCNYHPRKEEYVDSNFKAMMNCLKVQHSNMQSLDDEIAKLQENINKTYDICDRKFISIADILLHRLRDIQEKNNYLFDGPTIDIVNTIFNDYKDHIEAAEKYLRKVESQISKICETVTEIKNNPNFNEECAWMKCLTYPDDFVEEVHEIEKKLSTISQENEMLMKKSRLYHVK